MSRLPQPGGDEGQWGQILNDFLGQVHNTDGSLKPNTVNSSALAPNAVNESSLGVVDGDDGQVLVKDSGSATGLAWATAGVGTVSDAATTTKGIVRLSGDLGGTADAPTVPGLATKANSAAVYTKTEIDTTLASKADTSVLSGYVATTQKGVANGVASLDGAGKVPSAQLPEYTVPVTSVAGKTGAVTLTGADIGLSSVDNTSDANKPISTATQTALNAKADTTTVVHLTGNETIAGVKTFSSSPIVPAPNASNEAANKTYVDNLVASGVAPDATATVKGVVQLATTSEATTGTNTVKAVTPAGLAAAIAATSPATVTDRVTVVWDTATAGYPSQAATPPVGIMVREFIGPQLPTATSWPGVVDLYTYASFA